MAELVHILPECFTCRGKGEIQKGARSYVCPACEGQGRFPPEFLSSQEAADFLKVSRSSLHNYREHEGLPYYRLSARGKIRYERWALIRWFEGRRICHAAAGDPVRSMPKNCNACDGRGWTANPSRLCLACRGSRRYLPEPIAAANVKNLLKVKRHTLNNYRLNEGLPHYALTSGVDPMIRYEKWEVMYWSGSRYVQSDKGGIGYK